MGDGEDEDEDVREWDDESDVSVSLPLNCPFRRRVRLDFFLTTSDIMEGSVDKVEEGGGSRGESDDAGSWGAVSLVADRVSAGCSAEGVVEG